jgi:pimeloyl-ACP methyl ester carboxylesterase
MKKLLACALVAMAGCPDVNVDPDETAGPVVEFDPARSLATGARFIPFPNDLARDPATGKLNLGPQACESATAKATREAILNKLDGFGTYETAMQVTFSAEVDEASLADNIVMYQLTNGGQPNDPASAVSIPVVVRKGTTLRFLDNDHCDAPETVNAVAIIPMIPLKQKSTYFVALEKGIKDTTGKEFTGAFTWSLVASANDPVTIDDNGIIIGNRTPLDPADEAQRAQLFALDQLWKLHAPGLQFLTAVPNARPRTDILVGFQFTTQTTTDPLDQSVTGSPANLLPAAGLVQDSVTSVTGKFGPYAGLCTAAGETNATQCFLKLALGGCSPLTTGCDAANYNAGQTICDTIASCNQVGDVLGGGLGQLGFQTLGPNPLAGGAMIPGAWSDPVHPEMQSSLALETLITLPASAPPATGYPTVIFGHGLGSSKEALLVFAGSLAANGYAAVAIDFSAHGSRAVRTSKAPALGCVGHCAAGGVPNATECDTIADCGMNETCGIAGASETIPPSPTSRPQCYAPFLSTNLAATRDGIRQTVLDIQRLAKALETCGAAGCGALKVDPTRIYYIGQSLGSLIGTTAVGTAPEIKDAVLNVGGVGWADVLENTQNLSIRCTLIDSLIDAQILQGEKWNGDATSPTGLCATDAWKAQPGYQTFAATLRWAIDPADGANFAAMTAQKRVLIQQVVNDQVVPNVATERQGALFGLMPANADPFVGGPASLAITMNANMNKWVKYANLPENGAFPGNTFEHASLLRPAVQATDGVLGTKRLQTDAIEFLKLNP